MEVYRTGSALSQMDMVGGVSSVIARAPHARIEARRLSKPLDGRRIAP